MNNMTTNYKESLLIICGGQGNTEIEKEREHKALLPAFLRNCYHAIFKSIKPPTNSRRNEKLAQTGSFSAHLYGHDSHAIVRMCTTTLKRKEKLGK